MPSDTLTFFQDFAEQLAKKQHDLNADTIKLYLSNTAPNVATHTQKSDIAEITVTNEANHGAGGADITNTVSETGGTATVAAVDVTFLASGGSVGPFRYLIAYNDTHASDLLIGYLDYGSAVTLDDGESLDVSFSTSSLMTVS